MASLPDANGISWKYYPQGPQGPQASTSLWTAPNAIQGVCQPALIPDVEGVSQCDGVDWKNNVAPNIPPTTPIAGEMAPILSDIQNCRLPAVSWVIPDGHWSDHPGGCANCPTSGTSGHFLGPAWLAAIFNSVGWATNCDTNGYWNDTVVLVTWDDWGGWYDHVSPSAPGGPGIGYSNRTGQLYVYGFRVPLLVVSAYSKTGYISGACGQPGQPACPNLQAPYVHDFGSILNFIEYAFGTGGNPLYMSGYRPGTGINPQYLYADALAPDAPANCSACPYSLSDFFNFSQPPT
jgi:phospholipase C